MVRVTQLCVFPASFEYLQPRDPRVTRLQLVGAKPTVGATELICK